MKLEGLANEFRERVENDAFKIEIVVKNAIKPFTMLSTTHKDGNITRNFKSLTINLKSF